MCYNRFPIPHSTLWQQHFRQWHGRSQQFRSVQTAPTTGEAICYILENAESPLSKVLPSAILCRKCWNCLYVYIYIYLASRYMMTQISLKFLPLTVMTQDFARFESFCPASVTIFSTNQSAPYSSAGL
uniref:Uncharacterized protein n=1 Tax=Cacopsylla melanoneura TaxID=428564 RepID=A0A8D9E911_9HEMI